MFQDFPEDHVLIQERGAVATITLNNPQSLNALSLEMIRQISSALHRWATNPDIKVVIFRGGEGRAFCSGGNVKSFYNAGMDYRRNHVSAKVPMVYFAEEYSMNKQIAHYPKPTIALMDGITMGGGYGIAGHCTHRIACEKTLFAMPEVGIGFFPDVGIIYHLLKTPHAFGRFLALTGSSIEAGDMLEARLADAYIVYEQHDAFCQAVLESPDTIDALIKNFSAAPPPPATFSKHKKEIETIFSIENIGGILGELKNAGTAWSKDILARLNHVSPISVCVTLSYLNRASKMSVDDVLNTDFTLTQHFISGFDLYEGIRATLIDKDRVPRWDTASYDKCDTHIIKHYFEDTGYNLIDVQIFDD